MQITVEEIRKISIQPGQTLIVSVDIKNMPPAKGKALMERVKELMRLAIPDANVGIIIVPAGTYSFGIIDTLSAGSGSGTKSMDIDDDPADAYDRAMRGLG